MGPEEPGRIDINEEAIEWHRFFKYWVEQMCTQKPDCHPQLQNCWPLQEKSYYPETRYIFTDKEPKKIGDFDLHLDSCGNLRVIRDGVLLQTFNK